MSTHEVTCDKCGGRGKIPVMDAYCEASFVLDNGPKEKISCWATRQHPGQPHLVLLIDQCPECGGYDKCAQGCKTHETADMDSMRAAWYSWTDADQTLVKMTDEKAMEWELQFFGPAIEEKAKQDAKRVTE